VPETAIRVEGLVKRFDEVVALAGIDLEVPAGTVFGLLGPNGAGKTTAVRVLATILRPDEGRAEILGHDVVRQASAVRSLIGLAGQYATVDGNLTGRENLALIGRLVHLRRPAIGKRAAELLERFDLTGAADRPVRTYSGGMRRRLDLAAALVQRPPVLFFDEPTTGLDPLSRNELWKMIEELVADGSTVVLTTQYLEEADKLASRVAVVDEGRVIANDTPAGLKAQLGSTVVEIEFDTEPLARSAEGLLGQRLTTVAERDGRMLRLQTHDGAGLLMDALRALDAETLEPCSLAVREPSLDDVFLALTGRHAESEDGAEPAGRNGDR
jgi:daunorubicin resistance ABC transporter ATP-binding subunit